MGEEIGSGKVGEVGDSRHHDHRQPELGVGDGDGRADRPLRKKGKDDSGHDEKLRKGDHLGGGDGV